MDILARIEAAHAQALADKKTIADKDEQIVALKSAAAAPADSVPLANVTPLLDAILGPEIPPVQG